MAAVFDVNHEQLLIDSNFAAIARKLSALSPIDSCGAFNRYCREACRLWKENSGISLGKTSARFTKLLGRIEQGGVGVIQTSWGGVVICLHEHPRVEKFLVVRKGGYLALETHELKNEWLQVEEGAGLILWRRAAGESLAVEVLAPSAQFHFNPGVEHCLIGTENLLVFERSIDPKGMDRDLVFIYEPDVV